VIIIDKPFSEDLGRIEEILSRWTEKEEVVKYTNRIRNEINGKTEFNMHFWVAKENSIVVGIVGLSDPLPKTFPFARSGNPGEIKILYVDATARRKGVGRLMVEFVEDQARNCGHSELLVRSAERYKDTAYGFYKKMGYAKVGKLSGGDKNNPMQVFSKTI
jgi:GNAT superfamily N-acetyltransferase